MQRIRDLTIDEFKAVIGESIEEKFRELLSGLDVSVVLRPDIQRRLAKKVPEPEIKSEDAAEPEMPRRREMEW